MNNTCFQKVFFRDGFSQTSELNLKIFFIKNNWMTFVKGTLSTLYISITGTVVGFFIGLLVALLRYSEAEIDGQAKKYKKIHA